MVNARHPFFVGFYLLIAAIVGGGFASAAQAADALWVVLKGSKQVAVLSADTLKPQSRIEVGAFPHEILIRGTTAVVSLYGQGGNPGNSLALIDIKSRKKIGEIPLGAGARPHGIIPTGKPDQVVVTAEGNNQILLVDLGKKAVIGTAKTTQGTAHLGTYDSKRNRVYVSNISSGTITAVSLEPFKILRHIKTGDEPEGIAYHAASDTLWVTHRKDNNLVVMSAEDYSVQHTLATGKFPIRVSFDASGALAVVSLYMDSKVQMFGTKPVRKVRDVSLFAGGSWTSRAWQSWQSSPRAIGQVFSPNTQSLFIALSGTNRVLQLDTQTFKHLSTTILGKTPDSMAITPDYTKQF